MNTLFARLSLALLAIVGLMGGGFFVVERTFSALYYEELTQELNAPIAMYVTEQQQLIRGGEPDVDSLQTLATHAMVINPSAEIYLLDSDGQILAHNMPDESVLTDRIRLDPIRDLISGQQRLPIRGDDPRSGGTEKVFSAAEVFDDGELAGYLYVVLGGQRYETLASDIDALYTGRLMGIGVLLIALAGAVLGVLVFRLLTRRLKHLNRELLRTSELGFSEPPRLWNARASGDEIDELALAFRAMSERIATQIEQLKENDKLRRELVSNISHDLRTPLAAMQGYIETLIISGDTLSPDERDRYLRIARRHTVRLGALIGDLFELSKLDATNSAPNLEPFALQELANDVVQEFQIEAERRGIELGIDVDTDSPLTVGDIGLIQRVLENLVRNAVRFTPNGGSVVISVDGKPESVAIAVSDTGPGIPEADLPRIFDRFYRAVDGEEARSDSAGLGLAIVKRILDLHDSRITVTSRIDRGTRFEFELPLASQAA